jgi:alpha-galactosidase/6-phospho-beta-glucosidase family protein
MDGNGGSRARAGPALSNEYAARIMQAAVSDAPYRFNGNVINTGLIPNLPDGCCVEVPCLADRQGVQACYVGPLPAQLAALNLSNIVVQELAVRAVLDKDREAASTPARSTRSRAASVRSPRSERCSTNCGSRARPTRYFDVS